MESSNKCRLFLTYSGLFYATVNFFFFCTGDVVFLFSFFFFNQRAATRSHSSACFPGECKARQMCENLLSAWRDPTGRRQSTVMSGAVSKFYSCDFPHTRTHLAKTLTHSHRKMTGASVPWANWRSFVPFCFLTVKKIAASVRGGSTLLFSFRLWLTVYLATPPGKVKESRRRAEPTRLLYTNRTPFDVW